MSELVFEPVRVRLARELKEWSQADLARGLGMTPAAVSQFESGLIRPSADAVGRMSALLDVPPTFFQLPIVETHEGFFRALRRTSVAHRRRARAIAQIAHDLALMDAANPMSGISTVPHAPVTDLAARRNELELAAQHVRAEWRLPRGPISNVVQLLEAHGIVVIRLPLDTADVDAFSLPFPDRPVVVLGADKNDRARSRFDAAHELGHLVLHGEQVWGVKEVERQADRFAAGFLMPESDIYDELPSHPDWPVLFDLKRKWQVSLAALLMRARTLERMSEGQYLSAVKAVSARGWRRVEPVPLGPPEAPEDIRALLASPAGRRASKALPGGVINTLFAAVGA